MITKFNWNFQQKHPFSHQICSIIKPQNKKAKARNRDCGTNCIISELVCLALITDERVGATAVTSGYLVESREVSCVVACLVLDLEEGLDH